MPSRLAARGACSGLGRVVRSSSAGWVGGALSRGWVGCVRVRVGWVVLSWPSVSSTVLPSVVTSLLGSPRRGMGVIDPGSCRRCCCDSRTARTMTAVVPPHPRLPASRAVFQVERGCSPLLWVETPGAFIERGCWTCWLLAPSVGTSFTHAGDPTRPGRDTSPLCEAHSEGLTPRSAIHFRPVPEVTNLCHQLRTNHRFGGRCAIARINPGGDSPPVGETRTRGKGSEPGRGFTVRPAIAGIHNVRHPAGVMVHNRGHHRGRQRRQQQPHPRAKTQW